MTTRLILVGGFLGAGKTTALWQAAQRLARSGHRVGLITNDQAPELVDTALLARGPACVAEVNGSCFCCNFPGLLDAAARLAAAPADVLIAEPVGSCTDLSATILQPLKERHGGEFLTAPLSVMLDPQRLRSILDGGTGGLHPSAAYIYRKQIEEADVAVINKADLLAPGEIAALQARLAPLCPGAALCAVSAKTGAGMDAWLDLVMAPAASGARLAAVDYDVYAEGEAVLGWLNATLALRGRPTDWKVFLLRLLRQLSRTFDRAGAAVGHVKALVEAEGVGLVGNLTGPSDTLELRGDAVTGCEAKLTLNARVQTTPSELEQWVRQALTAACQPTDLAATTLAWRCLSPGRPRPTYRYDHVVAAG